MSVEYELKYITCAFQRIVKHFKDSESFTSVL
jgi:hypothetical protein